MYVLFVYTLYDVPPAAFYEDFDWNWPIGAWTAIYLNRMFKEIPFSLASLTYSHWTLHYIVVVSRCSCWMQFSSTIVVYRHLIPIFFLSWLNLRKWENFIGFLCLLSQILASVQTMLQTDNKKSDHLPAVDEEFIVSFLVEKITFLVKICTKKGIHLTSPSTEYWPVC